MLNTTNLLTQKFNSIQKPQPVKTEPIVQPAVTTITTNTTPTSSLLNKYLENIANVNKAAVTKPTPAIVTDYKNNLRTTFVNNEAKILAIVPRTFNAKDVNGNEYIDGNEKSGTLLSAIERLDEVKAHGFNALHLLPLHPPGKERSKGIAGSIYSPLNMLEIDPVIIDKNDPRTPDEQFKAFTDECHKRGIKVMLDLFIRCPRGGR